MDWPVIDAIGVTKGFGGIRALDGFTWTGGGGVIGVLGPNGAGKTTLLRILGTVLTPDHGTMRISGLDPARSADRLAIRRNLGYLPQHDHLYRSFTVYDLLDYVAVLKEITGRDTRRAEVRRVLAAVGLDDHRHRRIRTLSGGMQRRASLATALLGDPGLLVLDEPSTGLDPDQRLRLRDLLSDAGRRGTVLLSTHQTTEVEAVCRSVIVLVAGRLVFQGPPSELAGLAGGRVWIDEQPHPDAVRSWVTGDNLVRSIGSPPAGAQLVAPTVDDGYLLLTSGGRT